MTDDSHNTITGGIFFNAVIQGRDITVTLPAQIFPAMTGLPPATPSFTGRDADLTVLLDTLTPPEDADAPAIDRAVPTLVTAAVGGMGGVGKTELALQGARAALARGWFPGGVLFVDMRGYETDPALRVSPSQALEGFLRAVGVPGEQIPTGVQDKSRLLRSVLAAYAAEGRRVLLVVDNVSTSGQAQPLLPSDGACAAIVTSRHVLADLDARLLNLDALPANEAAELLDKALRLRDPADSRVRDQSGDAMRLADLCAGLPLALQIVAAQLAANPAKPLAATIADLDEVATRLEGMTFADRAVHAVFDTSYHELADAQARLFRLLSLNPGPAIATAAAIALTGLPETEAVRGLEALAQAHLIEPGTVYGRWRMHDLLRLHSIHHGQVRAEQDQRGQALTRLLAYYFITTKAANAHLDPRVTNPARLGFPDQEQAMGWLDTEYPNLTAATSTAATTNHPAIARDLPQAMWHFLHRRRHFNDWIALSHIAIDASRTLTDRDGEATALNGLGSALQQTGRGDEAVIAHTDAARLYNDIRNRHGEGKALINLGAALVRIGRSEQAVPALQDAVEIFHQTGDRLHEVMALQNLGTALKKIGRVEKAITIHTDAVRIYRDIGDRHGEAQALNDLGNDLDELSRFDEAITAYQDAAGLYRETGDRHGEALTFNNRAVVLRRVRRFDEAVTADTDAIRLYRETDDRDGEGETLQNLGITLRQIGRFDEAVTAHQDAALICRELGERFREAAALHGLGMAFHEVRRFDEAVTACQDAAQIFGELGDEHNEKFALEDLRRAQTAQNAARPRWWHRRQPGT